MKILFTTTLLLLTLCVFGQSGYDDSKISNKIEKLVQKIENVNQLMSSAVYYSGMRPEQYDNFEELRKFASSEELKELTNHPNGVVRSYSFWALSLNNSPDLFSILLDHLSDEEMVSTQFGCIGSQEKVGDFFISVVTPNKVDLDAKKLTTSELKKLDSILVYKPNNLGSKYGAIQRIETTDSNYSKIRELYIEKKDQSALVKLAKYNNPNDIDLILKNREPNDKEESGFFHTYKAISYFPHSSFANLLENNLKKTLDNTHYSNEWTQLYRAIASYKSEKAKELLEVPFTEVEHKNIRKYHLNMVFAALNEFKAPIYDDILWKIWGDENKISPEIFEYLKSLDSERALELTKKSMQSPNELDVSNFDYELSDSVKTLKEEMLDLIIEKDKNFGYQLIRENIEKSNVHNFPLYSQKAAEIKDESFVKPLIERFKDEWNSYIFLSAAKTLLSYNDDNINQKILAARKKNKNLRKDWGGKALDKLLAEKTLRK